METTSRGFTIHYITEGSGIPLVLVPGLTQSLNRWIATGYVASLAQDFQVIAVDPLGHGKSDKPHAPAQYQREHLAADIAAVLDAERVANAHLWGYSWGGGTVQAVARLAPGRVRSLIVGGQLFPQPALQAGEKASYEEIGRALGNGDWQPFWSAFGLHDPAVRAVLQEGNDPAAMGAAMKAEAGEGPEVATMPPGGTLVYLGTEERDFATGRELALAAGARFEAVPNSGHVEAFRDRAYVEPLVRAHLASAERSARLA